MGSNMDYTERDVEQVTPTVRGPTRVATCAVIVLSACIPEAPSQMAGMECEKAPSSAPSEVTADPNVNIVIADRAFPRVLDGNEVVTWDGRLVHRALARPFFCHVPERTIVALEEAPGLHKVEVMIRVFGNPDGPYAGLTWELKSEHPIEVPESGAVVLNLDLFLGEPHFDHGGTNLLTPQFRYRPVNVPGVARR
jgi:hypothetical protein